MDAAFLISDEPDYRLITVTGDIDVTNGRSFKLACSCVRPVIVDLLQCSYMDSVGLAVLIDSSRTGELLLALAPSSRIHRIFAITGLLAHFSITTTANEATRKLSGTHRNAHRHAPNIPYVGVP